MKHTSHYTKQRNIMQYTEIVYYRDGMEFAREEVQDCHTYDTDPMEDMTDEEIEDWV